MPFSAGAASRHDNNEGVKGVKDGEVQTGERKEVAGAALTEEFARRAVYSGAIAECHGGKQGGGVPVEMRLGLGDEVGANKEEAFAQCEGDRELRALPISGITVGASADVLSTQISRAIRFAGIACRTGWSDAGVQQEACTDVESGGGGRKRRAFLCCIG